MKFIKLLQEGRVEDFSKKFSKKFSPNQLQQIIKLSDGLPGNNKYLMWLGNVLDPTNFDGVLEKLDVMLNRFYEVSNQLERKEIEKYTSVEDLLNALDEYQNRVRRSVESVEGSDVVYDDDTLTVVSPYTHKASCYYGKGTKWCTASKDSSNYFDNYNSKGKLFYFLDKKRPTSDRFYKVAYVYHFDGERQFFDAPDNEFNTGWLIDTDYLNGILDKIDEYVKSRYSEQLEIFADKKRREEELARLDRERLANINRRQLELANERRESNEWPYGKEDGTAEYAWALYYHLTSTGELDGHTDDEIFEYYKMKEEREELSDELSAGVSEERETEIEERIDEIDEAMSDYLDTPDVYNLLPMDYGYYGLKMFEVIETDQEWVIGLTSEIEEAAIEYEKNLLDDIGIEGIRESFLEDYIDTDKVEEYARELYEQIVYDDLDSYFDDDVRELSRNQEMAIENKTNEISDKKDEITNLQEELSELENMDDENWNQDRIDEIESEISDLESEISDLEYEIDEIKEDPDGDIPDDLINEKIDDLVSDYVNNPLSFIREFGYNLNDFIDIDELAKGIVDTDGVEVMSGYDGNVYEETYLNEDYSIFRHN